MGRRVAGKKATLTSYPDCDDDTINLNLRSICKFMFVVK